MYFINRYQWSYLNVSINNWAEISPRVPQSFILGPMLFNSFLNDIFFFTTNSRICNYSDKNTSYTIGKNLDKLKFDL